MQFIKFLIFFLFFYSCSQNNDDNILATFNNEELFLMDIIKTMPEDVSDSSLYIKEYINSWVRKELMFYHAEINLDLDINDYNIQVEEYKKDLIIYNYQEQLINQKFDTIISSEDVLVYYNKFKEQFKLKKNIFKGRYIQVEKSAPKLDYLSYWYNQDYNKNPGKLEDYCQQFAKNYHLEELKWQYFSTISDKISDHIISEKAFLKNENSIILEDKNYYHYIYIMDYKLKGDISPLEIEEDKIRNLILNKKKIKYLKDLENELYNDALLANKIKLNI